MRDAEVTNRRIARRVLWGCARGALARPTELRYQVVREAWALAKRVAAGDAVRNLDVRELPALRDAIVEGYVDDRNRAVLAALCRALEARTFFEIGTNRGRTALTVARSNPGIRVFTLDLPDPAAAKRAKFALLAADQGLLDGWDRGVAFRAAPESSRIEQLLGDSATFDYGPYTGRIDVVFIDGSHAYPYVRADTEAALRMLSPRGAIVWDDYPGFPGVFRCVLDAAARLDGPVVHVTGTRMAIWSRPPLDVEPLGDSE